MQKLKQMWDAFMEGLKSVRSALTEGTDDDGIQVYDDIESINWLAIAVQKLSRLACNEATFEVKSDSAFAQALKGRAKNLENNRFKITEGMLSGGDYYVFPSTDGRGNIYHSYLDSSRVRITETDGEEIRQAYAVIDCIQPNKYSDTVYFLQRQHRLDTDGTLTVSYAVVNEQGKEVAADYWGELTKEVITFYGANHIGFGRYKSPVSSRGLSPLYGVPLNFGCSDIENKINETIKQIETEFKNAKSVIFTDPRNVIRADKSEYKIAENIIPVRRNSGDSAPLIDIFNPSIRDSAYFNKLNGYLEKYEQQIGVSKGIFTNNSATETATATAVKRANSDTIALINSIHASLDEGNKMTLEADAVFMNIRPDIWEYASDYFDPFEDPSEQWNRLKEAKELGAAESADLIKWINPSLTDEQLEEKRERIEKSVQKPDSI